jgi:hypothetical protein
MAGGQCTGLQSRSRAWGSPVGMPVDEVLHLVPSFEAALQARWHAVAPSIMSGCPSHSVSRWLNQDKLTSSNHC